jgi:hypothetical protein
VAVPDRLQQAFARFGGGAGTRSAPQQSRERERAKHLQPDEEKRVVVGARIGERLHVESCVDPRRQVATGNLCDQHEERKRRDPSPSERAYHHPVLIIRRVRCPGGYALTAWPWRS